MNNNIFKIGLGITAAVIIGVIIVLGGDSSENDQVELSSHNTGSASSKVQLVEYGDFQCSACQVYYPVLKEVEHKYKEQLNLQFKNFPISQIHSNTMAAHRSAEAASKQGKFWEMHDLLYENQQVWAQSQSPTRIFENYAADIGLDIEQFELDRDSSETLKVINADTSEGKASGVNGTPTFFINGEKIETPEPTLEAFSRVIDPILN